MNYKANVSLRIIGYSIVLLPLWWILGVEQFVWPLLFGVALLSIRRIRFIKPAKWLFVFLIVQLISSTSIDESYRWLTFLRTWGAYLGAFLGFIVVTTGAKTERDIFFLTRCLLLGLGLSVVAGSIAIVNIWRPEIQTVISVFLPPEIGETMYGKRILLKDLGTPSWFVGLGQYFRVNSFFLYATMYAPVLVVLLPVVLWKLKLKKGIFCFLFWMTLLILTLINLVYTTARMSIVGFLTGAAYYIVKTSKKATLFLASGVVMMCVMIQPWHVNIEEIWQTALYARGEGSVISRFGVYQATISGILERPILGWGTERDVPGLLFPAGSHSYYLGVLYKYGFVGLLVFSILYWNLWKYTAPIQQKRNYMSSLLQHGRWSLIAVIINGTTDVLDLDTTTLVIFWVFMGILVATRSIIIKLESAQN